jgi:hypothetical protein
MVVLPTENPNFNSTIGEQRYKQIIYIWLYKSKQQQELIQKANMIILSFVFLLLR